MISYEQTLADLRKIAEEKKATNGGVDYKYVKAYEGRQEECYPRCLYVNKAGGNLTPGCIIGLLLTTVHNVSLKTLDGLQFSMFDGRARLLVENLGLPFSVAAAKLLTNVQYAQDHGDGWVDAVEKGARLPSAERLTLA